MMAEHHEHHSTGYKTYFMTWVWLLVLTALALGLGYTHIDENLSHQPARPSGISRPDLSGISRPDLPVSAGQNR